MFEIWRAEAQALSCVLASTFSSPDQNNQGVPDFIREKRRVKKYDIDRNEIEKAGPAGRPPMRVKVTS